MRSGLLMIRNRDRIVKWFNDDSLKPGVREDQQHGQARVSDLSA